MVDWIPTNYVRKFEWLIINYSEPVKINERVRAIMVASEHKWRERNCKRLPSPIYVTNGVNQSTPSPRLIDSIF